MSGPDLTDSFQRLSGLITEAAADANVADAQIEAFMDGLLDLYLALKQDPSKRNDPAFERFVDETISPVAQLGAKIDSTYVQEIVRLLGETWYDEEWLKVVRRRSALAALFDVYADIDLQSLFDTDDLDRMIRERSRHEGHLRDDEIPAGVPTSHAWWWWPNEPH